MKTHCGGEGVENVEDLGGFKGKQEWRYQRTQVIMNYFFFSLHRYQI